MLLRVIRERERAESGGLSPSCAVCRLSVRVVRGGGHDSLQEREFSCSDFLRLRDAPAPKLFPVMEPVNM